jgi:hypothetical protein
VNNPKGSGRNEYVDNGNVEGPMHWDLPSYLYEWLDGFHMASCIYVGRDSLIFVCIIAGMDSIHDSKMENLVSQYTWV